MKFLGDIQYSAENYRDRNAFFLNETYYSYTDFARAISKIRKALNSLEISDKNIGLVANNDLETYASIIALWLEGKAYIPLNPDNPADRNENVISQAEIRTILDSSQQATFQNYSTILTTDLPVCEIDLDPKKVNDDEIAYILFTSGTTGVPKGVPISRANLSGFIKSFEELGYSITEEDRFLQMFDLTFDLSVMSYLVPLLKGACVYPVPPDKIKYSYIFELMDEHDLTFSLMVPSILHYLRPYFHEINCPKMKYSLFCGEALPEDISQEWSRCLPNAEIINVYGPTEDTIFCTHYTYRRNAPNKSHNGILSVGKSMNYNFTIVVNDENEILPAGEKGELCLGGIQLTPGYWRNEEKNKEAFFTVKYNGAPCRFYRTGDLAYKDMDGDMLYLGRKDFQVKVQGFRVELSEIEFHAKTFLTKTNVVAIAFSNAIDNSEIGLVIESDKSDTSQLLTYLRAQMPAYMVPTQIRFINNFPLNVNGKTDRNKLTEMFK